MKYQDEFILFENVTEFYRWLNEAKVKRTVKKIQNHHTYRPGYKDFNGNNHFQLVRNMKNYHVDKNGWSDIAQHFTSFPDGTIVTGRDLSDMPAGIKGANRGAICIEHLGYFDIGADEMTEAHKDIIVGMNAALANRFDLKVNEDTIIYHHWWDRETGKRTNGTGKTKSCPGTNFFGGNTVGDAVFNFYPLIAGANFKEPVLQAEKIEPKEPDLFEKAVIAINDNKEELFDQYEVLVSTAVFWEDANADERKHLPSTFDKAMVILGVVAFVLGVIVLRKWYWN